jgi:hypothetical protein
MQIANPLPPETPAVRGNTDAAPLADLVGRLSDDLRLLARQEGELAKRELSESFDKAKHEAAGLAVGAGALLLAMSTLVAGAVLLLATVVPAWAAALLVGAALAVLGVALLLRARAKLSRLTLKPREAAESVEADIAAIKRAAQ